MFRKISETTWERYHVHGRIRTLDFVVTGVVTSAGNVAGTLGLRPTAFGQGERTADAT
jgi:hypothetical protein